MRKRFILSGLVAIVVSASFATMPTSAGAASLEELRADGCNFNPVHRVWLKGDYYCGPNASGLFEPSEEMKSIAGQIQAERAKEKPSQSLLAKLEERHDKASRRHKKQVHAAIDELKAAKKAFRNRDYRAGKYHLKEAAKFGKQAYKSGKRKARISKRIANREARR